MVLIERMLPSESLNQAALPAPSGVEMTPSTVFPNSPEVHLLQGDSLRSQLVYYFVEVFDVEPGRGGLVGSGERRQEHHEMRPTGLVVKLRRTRPPPLRSTRASPDTSAWPAPDRRRGSVAARGVFSNTLPPLSSNLLLSESSPVPRDGVLNPCDRDSRSPWFDSLLTGFTAGIREYDPEERR